MSGGIIVVDTGSHPTEDRGLVLRTQPVASSVAQREGILLDLEHRTSQESMPADATTGWSVRAAGGFKSGRWPGITCVGIWSERTYQYNNTTISLSSPPQLGAFQQNVFCPTPHGNHVFKIYDGGAVLYSVSTHGRRWSRLTGTPRSTYAFFCKEDKSLVLVLLYTNGKAEFITVDLVYGQDKHWVETGYGDYTLVCHLGSEVVFFSNTKQRYVKVAGRFGCKTASEGVFTTGNLSISGSFTKTLGGDGTYALQTSSGFIFVNKTNYNSNPYGGMMFQFNGTICWIITNGGFYSVDGLSYKYGVGITSTYFYGVVNDMVLLWNGSTGAQPGIYYEANEDTYKVQNGAWYVGDATNMTGIKISTISNSLIPGNDMPLSWNVFMKNDSSTTIYQSSHASPGEVGDTISGSYLPSERGYQDTSTNTAPTNIIQNSSLAFNIIPGKISSLPGGYAAYTLTVPSPFYSFGFKTLSGRILIVWAWEDKANVYVYTSSLERINVNIIAHSGRKCVGVSGQYYTGVLVWTASTGTLLSIINDSGYEFYTYEFTTGKTTAAQVYTNIYSWGNMSAIYTRHVYTGYSLCMKTWVKGMKMKKVNDARLERDASQTATLNPSRGGLAACTLGNYALFAGGYDGNRGIYDTINTYAFNSSYLVNRLPDLTLSSARFHLAACTISDGTKEYALFGGGQTSFTGSYSNKIDVVYQRGNSLTTDYTQTKVLSSPRGGLAACTISDGQKQYALFGGGNTSSGKKTTIDIFTIENGILNKINNYNAYLSSERDGLAACTISDGTKEYALFGGGMDNQGYIVNKMDVFTIENGALNGPQNQTETLSVPRYSLAACTISDGTKQYALFGGGYNDGYINVIDMFTIKNGKLTRVQTFSLSGPCGELSACTISAGTKQYALFGGGLNGQYLNTIDVFKLISGTTTNSLNISSSSFKPALNFEMDGGSPPGAETVYENNTQVAKFNHGMIQAVVGQKKVQYAPLTMDEAMEEADEDEKIDYMYVFKQ